MARGGVENTRLEAKTKDSPFKDRLSRGQGQECLRPRPRTKDTGASLLKKKKKEKGLQTNFSGELQKKVFKNFFHAIYKILTINQSIVYFVAITTQFQLISSRKSKNKRLVKKQLENFR